jgi:hypothetical protein
LGGLAVAKTVLFAEGSGFDSQTQLKVIFSRYFNQVSLQPNMNSSLIYIKSTGMTDDPVSASSRGFTSKNEKMTEKYLNELEKYFKDQNICKRIHKLVEEAGSITRKQIKC